MPGNIIQINGSKDLEWYVGDSKMPKLVKTLNNLGSKHKPEISVVKTSAKGVESVYNKRNAKRF